jgi:hypothetical protein
MGSSVTPCCACCFDQLFVQGGERQLSSIAKRQISGIVGRYLVPLR